MNLDFIVFVLVNYAEYIFRMGMALPCEN